MLRCCGIQIRLKDFLKARLGTIEKHTWLNSLRNGFAFSSSSMQCLFFEGIFEKIRRSFTRTVCFVCAAATAMSSPKHQIIKPWELSFHEVCTLHLLLVWIKLTYVMLLLSLIHSKCLFQNYKEDVQQRKNPKIISNPDRFVPIRSKQYLFPVINAILTLKYT
jgi:hypothetical protein